MQRGQHLHRNLSYSAQPSVEGEAMSSFAQLFGVLESGAPTQQLLALNELCEAISLADGE